MLPREKIIFTSHFKPKISSERFIVIMYMDMDMDMDMYMYIYTTCKYILL